MAVKKYKKCAATNCENCVNYVYDEQTEMYSCLVNLDEDEMLRFISGSNDSCSYFRADDEYALSRKQASNVFD